MVAQRREGEECWASEGTLTLPLTVTHHLSPQFPPKIHRPAPLSRAAVHALACAIQKPIGRPCPPGSHCRGNSIYKLKAKYQQPNRPTARPGGGLASWGVR
eukprot:CAMPEP_0174349056 /NCGR_PEP_ID=MMETSP0811_2-20130205/5704_1 /TAXON_ID=73025 ORGANISM="Eutreptiella gymnastica-like, Strain CCMP1594" /NCGR_SAMPLE_ID=MMETSP0811_2 /ASSEMBLY_ACC=CAM_ASM_000667 /LENGTH=100 /DNA_ID=CAMNT_0015476157 /DNA_START=610 /DNA_END=909 /DNA_ORIENTATION=+